MSIFKKIKLGMEFVKWMNAVRAASPNPDLATGDERHSYIIARNDLSVAMHAQGASRSQYHALIDLAQIVEQDAKII